VLTSVEVERKKESLKKVLIKEGNRIVSTKKTKES